MALKVVNTESLDAVANAINAKAGTSGALQFPDGFVSAVEGISAGGGGSVPAVLGELVVTKNGVYKPSDSAEHGGTYTFKEVIDEETLSKNVWKTICLADFENSPSLQIENMYSSCDAFGMFYEAYVYIYKLGTHSSLYGVDSIGWYETNWDMPIPTFTKTSAPTITGTLHTLYSPFSMELLLSCIEEGNVELDAESTFTFKSDLSHIDWEQFSDFEEMNMPFIEWADGSILYCQPDGEGSYELTYNDYSYVTEKAAAAYSMPESGWYDWSGDTPVKVNAPTITLPSSCLVEGDSGTDSMYVYPQELSGLFMGVACDGFDKVTVDVDTNITFRDVLNNYDSEQVDLTYDMLEGVHTIPPYAFWGYRLGLIEIPEGVQTIGKYAFSLPVYDMYGGGGDTPSRTIKIPASVSEIENQAFSYTTIAELYCYGSTPPTSSNGGQPFYYAKIETMYVPKGSTTVYDEWIRSGYCAQYPTIVEMEDTTE